MIKRLKLVAAATAAFACLSASAATTYVGSWQVDQGPSWEGSTALSGQEAAALLFGGSASDYVISTGADTINDLAWVSVWGGGASDTPVYGEQVAQDFVISTGGLYANWGDTSAYVNDWAQGSVYTNYAWRVTSAVPEPTNITLMLAGVAAAAAAAALARRRNSAR